MRATAQPTDPNRATRPPRPAVAAALATLALALIIAPGMPARTAASAEPAAPASRPNFVVLMMDDLGFGDLGCYGGEIRTPNIDGLAAAGLRFRRFSNAARCCPTRASLMTGVYQHQVKLTGMGQDMGRQAATIPEHLKAAGYQTAMTGKWHLSSTRPLGGNDSPEHMAWLAHRADRDRPFSNLATYPVNRGFERHYGTIWGVGDFFDPFSLVDGTTNIQEVPPDYYVTDAITAKTVEYIGTMARKPDPFFLYVAHMAPHWPVQARPEDIAKYQGRYDRGWHALRAERYQRQVELGLVDPKTCPLPPLMGRGNAPDWDALTPEQRRYESALMEAHAAMVDRVDQGVGAIVQALKAAGRYENTVFLVLADNGASPERYLDTGFDRPAATRDGRPIQYRGTFTAGPETTWGYIGSWWANALNTPFRFWKAESFEGGTHTPLIAHWPAGMKARGGAITDQPGHVIDVAATCLDLAGAPPLTTLDGQPLTPIEGRSLGPIFAGQPRTPHDALFFEHEGGRAVIDRDGYKLVAQRGRPWELYHLATDATETTNLAAAEPPRVAAMSKLWVAWADRVGAEVPDALRAAAAGPAAADAARTAPIELTTGQVLDGRDAPRIANTPIRIEAVVRDGATGGVIVSQGAQLQGWALLVREGGIPAFVVRRDGVLHAIAGTTPLGAGETTLGAELRAGGTIALSVNGVEVATGTAGGLIGAEPKDPLIVGDDRKGAVGAYTTPYPFRGTVVRATLSRAPGR